MTRKYKKAEAVVFCKTRERFGGLSNMAAGFPLTVNGVRIRTSEALYQACRFPTYPEIQQAIIDQASPMDAKRVSREHTARTRPDWERIRVRVMRWSLRVKLVQNWASFSELLLSTGNAPIVELSYKDTFWGARPEGDQLVGVNALGRLLMELREEVRTGGQAAFLRLEPPAIPDFRLLGQLVGPVMGAGEL